MLVLGRKPGEYIMIGEDIMVKVVRSDKGDLRLAIDAPTSTTITRGELFKIQDNSHTINSRVVKQIYD